MSRLFIFLWLFIFLCLYPMLVCVFMCIQSYAINRLFGASDSECHNSSSSYHCTLIVHHGIMIAAALHSLTLVCSCVVLSGGVQCGLAITRLSGVTSRCPCPWCCPSEWRASPSQVGEYIWTLSVSLSLHGFFVRVLSLSPSACFVACLPVLFECPLVRI